MMWPIYNLEIQVPIVSGSSNEFVTEGREKGASWSGQVIYSILRFGKTWDNSSCYYQFGL